MTLVQRADRFRLPIPITYRASGNEEWLISRVVNISESGVLFGPVSLEPGVAVEVIISAPVAVGSRVAGPLVYAGRVVRATETGVVAARFDKCRVLLEG